MNKREEREHKFRLLFMSEFLEAGESGMLMKYFESPEYDKEDGKTDPSGLSEDEKLYLYDETEKIIEKKPEIDEKLRNVMTGWKTERLSKADLTILRLAVYEMLFSKDIPEKVSVNEAVELSKKYGGTETGAFVNGVLARILDPEKRKEEEKPVRQHIGELTDRSNVQVLINR